MTLVVTVIIVALLRKAACDVIVMINVGVVVMIIIVIMKDGCRFFMVQMTMHTLYRRPGELEGNDHYEEDGKHTTHGVIVPNSDNGLGSGCRARPAPGLAHQPTVDVNDIGLAYVDFRFLRRPLFSSGLIKYPLHPIKPGSAGALDRTKA